MAEEAQAENLPSTRAHQSFAAGKGVEKGGQQTDVILASRLALPRSPYWGFANVCPRQICGLFES